MGMMNNFYRYKYLLWVLVTRDIKKKYRRSILGILWSMLNPLLMMIVTAMVFSTLFRFDIPNYILYLLIGQVFFSFFSESTNFAMNAILDNASLLKKVYVPKYLFPVSRVLSSCVNLLFTLPPVLFMMYYTEQYPTFDVVSIFIPLVALLIFCTGIGLALSAVAVYFRDILHLYGVILTALQYSIPIIYPEKIIPLQYKFLLLYNPLYYYLSAFRQVVYMCKVPDIHTIVACYVFAIISLFVGVVVFKKAQNQFILYI